jgi:hypothetical protein
MVGLQIARYARKLNMTAPTVIVSAPTFANIATLLRPERIIYYRSDLHSAFAGADQAVLRSYEALLLERADKVVYSNASLFESERTHVGEKAQLVGHGVDVTLFTRDGPTSPEIDCLPSPRVGFFGELRGRSVDFELIAQTARLCASVHFVLGGEQLDDLRRLKDLPNVHLLGPCPHELMPARWRSVDAAILPYRKNRWSESSEPIKLNEILATGLKAIGTSLPALKLRPEAVSIADDPDGFARCIHAVLQERMQARPPEEGGVRDRLKSWDSIADRICGPMTPPASLTSAN